MLKRFLYRTACLLAMLLAVKIGLKLSEGTDNPLPGIISLLVVVILFVIVIPVCKLCFPYWMFYLDDNLDERKRKQYYKKVRKSGLSEGEYVMTLLHKDALQFIESHINDIPLLENYIKKLSFGESLTFYQADALLKHIKFLNSDRSEGAYVLSLLPSSDADEIMRFKSIPALQEAYIQRLTNSRIITPAQAEALVDYCRKTTDQL